MKSSYFSFFTILYFSSFFHFTFTSPIDLSSLTKSVPGLSSAIPGLDTAAKAQQGAKKAKIILTILKGLASGITGTITYKKLKYKEEMKRWQIDQVNEIKEVKQKLHLISMDISLSIADVNKLITQCEEQLDILKSKTIKIMYDMQGHAETLMKQDQLQNDNNNNDDENNDTEQNRKKEKKKGI